MLLMLAKQQEILMSYKRIVKNAKLVQKIFENLVFQLNFSKKKRVLKNTLNGVLLILKSSPK